MAEGADVAGGLNMNPAASRARRPAVNNNGHNGGAADTRRKSRRCPPRRKHQSRVLLEKVLGVTTAGNSGLTCDPNSALTAYIAGCVVVLLHPKKNKQTHILNSSRKPFTALAFSQDGKYLVTGESGHMPCVRVWEVVERNQVAEVQSHKYGVACVAFSANTSYIVSVGYQHDMTVSVWEWRKGTIIASNKVSSRVVSVSFSEDNRYFVTAGNRHIKFWNLDAAKERRVNSTVPLIGRSGLLGEHKNSLFCGVACGRGNMAAMTYCITSSGLLCLFTSRRQLEAWVHLKVSTAGCLSVSEEYVFCGCADGTVRVFSPVDLQYITTLPQPHRLGVDITQSPQHSHPGADYPDTLALTYDPVARQLTCIYNDHSVYVWDVQDLQNVGKLYSALYHSSCVWSVEVYPDLAEPSKACLPAGSFLTCSSDNTIRLWHANYLQGHANPGPHNPYSNDLFRIVYVGDDTQHLQGGGEPAGRAGADGKTGIRVLRISPDGQHLAAGDRCGNLRIFGLKFLDELVRIEAHDSEVLCLEFSPTETGLNLLASASRDRLIHVFDCQQSFSLAQTLYDHSGSVTAIKFTGVSPAVRMVSCGADKSIYFHTAEQTCEGLTFSRRHHVVEKNTLYDMDLDATTTHATIACQDRNIRVYDVETGKLTRCFKGTSSDEGTLLKIRVDPSGTYLATSCSDKNISLFDYESGECVATLFGHSEIVTCMRFSQDCRHLITGSGDSCVFVWRLDSQMTNSMRRRLRAMTRTPRHIPSHHHSIRRETYITVPAGQLAHTQEEAEMEAHTPVRLNSTYDFPVDPPLLQTNGRLPMWFRKLQGEVPNVEPKLPPLRGRWAEQANPLTICSQFSQSPAHSQDEEEDEEDECVLHPQSLDSLLAEEATHTDGSMLTSYPHTMQVGKSCSQFSQSPPHSQEEEEEADEEEDEEDECVVQPDSLDSLLADEVCEAPDEEQFAVPGLSPPVRNDYILYPTNSTALSNMADVDFDVQALSEADSSLPRQRAQVKGEGEELSSDSACCEGSAGSQDQPADDTDSLSSMGSSEMEEEEDALLKNHFDTLTQEEKFDTDLETLQPPDEQRNFLNPRLSISTRFLSRFKDRIRVGRGQARPPVAIPPKILEENSSINTTQVSSETSRESKTDESNSDVNVEAPLSRSRTQSPVLDTEHRYTGTKTSCSPQMSQDGSSSREFDPATSSSANQGVNEEPSSLSVALGDHGVRTSLRLELNTSSQIGVSPASQKAQQCGGEAPSSQPAMSTPAEIMSLIGEEKRPTGSLEESLAAIGHPRSPTPSTSPSAGGDEKRGVQAEQGSPVDLCQQVIRELKQSVSRALDFYEQMRVVNESSEQQLHVLSVMKEAFSAAHADLGSVLPEGRAPVDDRTLALLEKYSHMLLQITKEKLAEHAH
ncbi:WD repeat-containing protein 62 [Lampris incognitus]|uniref:WD repeat-containing protein 62 n=1 Tax=Lampris incognitus TaxID=2546036 RepID=UPI0024B61E1B|nr:WD repeat-containing protein 62 [Lampris incognitus]